MAANAFGVVTSGRSVRAVRLRRRDPSRRSDHRQVARSVERGDLHLRAPRGDQRSLRLLGPFALS